MILVYAIGDFLLPDSGSADFIPIATFRDQQVILFLLELFKFLDCDFNVFDDVKVQIAALHIGNT